MVLTEKDLRERLAALRPHGQTALDAVEVAYEEHLGWLQSVLEGVKNGSINVKSVLVPKTPGKPKRAALPAITENFDSSIDLDESKHTNTDRTNKRASRKAPTRKAATKANKVIELILEDETNGSAVSVTTKSQKRLSEESIDSASKRLCGNRSSGTTSRDSGLSSVGSRVTRGSTLGGGIVVKHEVLTPKNRSLQSDQYEEHDSDDDQEAEPSVPSTPERTYQVPGQSLATPETVKKRSQSAGRNNTFMVKQEPRRSSRRSRSEPRESINQVDRTFILSNEIDTNATNSCKTPDATVQLKNKANTLRSPIIKAPPAHLLKGESVKKAVKAFEALSEDHETASAEEDSPFMPPPSKLPQPKTAPTSQASSSLDDALNAPTRVTRTKTRAMAKAAAADEKKSEKTQDEQTISAASKMLKSPPMKLQQPLPQKNFLSASKAMDRDFYEKENTSRILLKPFGSASKQQPLFFKSTTPLNRMMTPLTPGYCSNSSLSLSRVNNLVTSVESFIQKPPVHHEVKPSREENLQKLVAKSEEASKKKEELMKAQREEKMRKRQEKRERVCAAREAMEKEKQEMQMRLEREREEKHRQLQAEREEKLRQEHLKKKRLLQQKAAETEERRRQEEAARIAKLKQQEEEQKRLAAQRKKEQEEAERKHMERLQQEREAAAHRAREAERIAKEAALKAKKESKVMLDQTYDKMSPNSNSYGMTPGPEERQPVPNTNADNYGIDDAGTDDSSEDEAKPKKQVPLWAQPKQRLPKLMEDYEINHNQMFVFFESKKSTPDLSKIFTAIDRRQLIRKSSAVWRTPPGKH